MRPTLSDCIELVLDQAGALADDVLDALTRLTAEIEGEPVDELPSAQVMSAVRVLLGDAPAVRATFASELRRLVFHSSSKDLAQNESVQFDDLRFYDIHEIEIHIELALARQEIIRAAEEILPQFDSLVSSLLGWNTVQPTLNPLKPEAFVRALLETLTAWIPNEDVRMDLLRPSAIAMGTGLRSLYREACEWMRSQGVRPVEPLLGGAGDGAAARARKTQSEVERTMQTLEKLRRLLAGEPHSRIHPGVMQDFTHTVPASLVALQDLKLVEPMMQRLAERSVRQLAVGKGSGAGAESIGQRRTREQNQQIGRMLGEEVVSLMIDQLVNDERLLQPVRLQLRSLEPALLQLARSDPRFFIDRRHAARQLLDRVVQRSLAYPADDEEAIAEFAGCVSDAVNALSRSAGDAAAYAGALADLEKAWKQRDEARLQRREDERRAREHTQQRTVLAQRYSQAMMERFRDSGLPELVASFLRGPWSQVLAERHLQNGGEQADPQGYRSLVDDLVWSVQLELVRQDHARLVHMIPNLLARLNEGLMLIRYPPEPIAIFLDDLSALHDKVLDEHRRALAAARAAARELGAIEDAPDSIGDLPDAPDSEAPLDSGIVPLPLTGGDSVLQETYIPSDQSVGAEVELMLDGAWVRAKLTWIGRNRKLFMFVSGAGLAHAMSRRTMDRLQTQGRIRVVVPVFDLLLESGVAPLAS
ncbi:MAG: DUF1631 family protein [Burkholderiaceae bacterium]